MCLLDPWIFTYTKVPVEAFHTFLVSLLLEVLPSVTHPLVCVCVYVVTYVYI